MKQPAAPAATAGAAQTPRASRRSLPGRISRLLRFAGQRAAEERLLQVASSLTLTTVLAMVPLLAVALSLFTAFPLFAEFRRELEAFLAHNLMPPAVSDNVMNYLNQFARQASRLTAIGGLFLVVTSVMLIMTIDQALNNIWHVRRQRPLPQRVLVYWAIITLGPVLAGASLWVTSFLARESLGLVGGVSPAAGLALSFVPVVLTGLGFSALFVIVPNRHVAIKDALAGGFGTAIVLELMKTGFAYYLTRFPAYTVIYGAFATLPVFLLWVYLSWLAVLLGAIIAAVLPSIRLGRWELARRKGSEFVDAVALLRALYHARGSAPPGRSARYLAQHLSLQIDEVLDLLDTLAGLGLVARIQDPRQERWILACDPSTTPLGPLLDRLLVDRHHPWMQDDPALRHACAALLADGQAAPSLGPLLQSAPPLRMAYTRRAAGKPIPMTEPAGSTETHHAQSQ